MHSQQPLDSPTWLLYRLLHPSAATSEPSHDAISPPTSARSAATQLSTAGVCQPAVLLQFMLHLLLEPPTTCVRQVQSNPPISSVNHCNRRLSLCGPNKTLGLPSEALESTFCRHPGHGRTMAEGRSWARTGTAQPQARCRRWLSVSRALLHRPGGWLLEEPSECKQQPLLGVG